MKVALLTMHRPLNFGSCLQTYATLEFLKDNGYSPFVVDYCYPNDYHKREAPYFVKNHAAPQHKSIWYRIINKLCQYFILRNSSISKNDKFKSFFLEKVSISQEYKNHEQLINNPPEADIYIVGSDQVWNPMFLGNDSTFLLDWVPAQKRKISYASSFSIKKLPDQYKNMYKKYLSQFMHISIREQSSIIPDLLNFNPQIVLDPTFLLDKNQWLTVTKGPSKIKGNYILCYLLTYSFNPYPYAYDLIAKVKRETGYQVVILDGAPIDVLKGYHVLCDCGPEDFLNLFQNASFVITSSFHGTAFAINFGIPFYSILNDVKSLDNRQVSILSMFGLIEQCAVEKNTDVNLIKYPNLDFKKISETLEFYRGKSKEYFINALKK